MAWHHGAEMASKSAAAYGSVASRIEKKKKAKYRK
jgi:hypothetical protein